MLKNINSINFWIFIFQLFCQDRQYLLGPGRRAAGTGTDENMSSNMRLHWLSSLQLFGSYTGVTPSYPSLR